MVKKPPAMQKTQVQSLGPEYPLEEEMATQSSILAWKTPQTEEPGGRAATGLKSSLTKIKNLGNHRVNYDEVSNQAH